jgi:hypothetical protein
MDTSVMQTAIPLWTHYWQVYFDTNRAIREAFGEAGFPAAEQPIVVRTDGQRALGAVRSPSA